jgi:poly(A) polymerase
VPYDVMLKRIKDLLSRRGKKQPTGTSPPDSATTVESARTSSTGTRPPVQVGPRVVHRPIPESDLDPDAVKIVNRLTRFDHSAYLVGGCVRDLLLDQRPKDFDIGTSATPRQIKRLFRNSRIIGRRFRLAHIYFQRGKIIEVATFRAQNIEENGDGSEVKKDLLIREDNLFGTPEEDALRRDFTVNALFYDVSRKTVLDHADGLGDLRRRLIRTIGDPEVRFREDPIRILRAIKFAARLSFDIERKTLSALKQARKEIPKAAAPRILEEVNRFCRGGAARRSFELLRQHGVFEILFTELAKAYDGRKDARDLLFAMLDHVDEKQRKGYEVPTGAILAVLLISVMREEFGWRDNGEVHAPKGLDVRATTDNHLRPLAQRLRVSRKDQEYCRQILLTLFRMVPQRRARRSTKRSILRRECLPDAVWILGTLRLQVEELAAAGRARAGRSGWRDQAASPAAPSSRWRLTRPGRSGRRAQSQNKRRAAACEVG